MRDFDLAATGALSRAARASGYRRFLEAAEAIRAMPYRRLRDPDDIAGVLSERQGTCSAKHRFLAALAHECGHAEIELVVGLYEMSAGNTPGVGSVLRAEGLDCVLEAHCYLVCSGRRHDFTGLPGASPFQDLLEEHVVPANDLPALKRAYHLAAMERWARARGIDPARAWAVRERCIAALAGEASA